MPALQFKGKTAVESYHHVVPHHILEFDEGLSEVGKGKKPGLDGNLIIREQLLNTLEGSDIKCPGKSFPRILPTRPFVCRCSMRVNTRTGIGRLA
jgi:hypothetical protein